MSGESIKHIPVSSKIIRLLAKENLGIQLVFVKEENGNVKVSHMNLDENSAEYIRKKCQGFIYEREKWENIDYFDQPDNEKTRGIVRTISINEIPKNKEFLKKSNNLELQITDELMKSTKIMGFRFEADDNKSVLFLKKISKDYFVLKNNKPFALVTSGVAKVYHGSLVKFPVDFDVVRFSEEIMIFKPYQFEEMFGFHEIYENDRKEVFEYIRVSADYDIQHLDDYERIVQSTKVQLRKFSAIKEKGIYRKSLADIKKILRKRTVKTVTITKKEIRFQDGTRGLINFFNDNHLDSQFTLKNYTAHSKTEE